jgi:peptidoglycan/LPS O-acetylase OafA/YrhL
MPPAAPQTGIIPKHLYSLDALRGIAALAVVFWHWQVFFFRGTELQPSFSASQQPLYILFGPLYTDGWRAVDLFFSLSGFVFFWLYSGGISKRETSGKEFFVLRFSRLYPLHCVTLLVVAAAQYFMLRHYGSHFVYAYNDSCHFALQTVLASNWGFERGLSFNGPIWSVSVEVLCYAVFFWVCRLRLTRWWWSCIFVCCGFAVQRIHLPDAGNIGNVGRGLISFFIGGLSFAVFERLAHRGVSQRVLRCFGVFVCVMWVIIPLNVHNNWLSRMYRHLCGDGVDLRYLDVGEAILNKASRSLFELMLFPTTIILLALWETHRGTLGRRWAFLGQISYSSYLLHFPLQILFFIVATSVSIQTAFFYSPLALFLFFLILIPLSLFTYKYFERPCRSRLRLWALKK